MSHILWSESTKETASASAELPCDLIDVAIIGGGFTGLSTALHCADAGLSAHVIEAQSIGHGGSGRNVGLVNAGVWMPPAKVLAHLGPVYGPRFLNSFSDGPQRVFDLIERHQIQCAPTRTGTIHAAHSPKGLRDLKARAADWAKLDAPVRLLDRAETAERVGSTAFYGGLWDARAGTINPMSYCRGLARVATANGARISTGMRAMRLIKEQDGWRIDTDHGDMRARKVVLATNAYTDALWPGLERCVTRIHFFQMATEPLGSRADHILPQGQGLWDTGRIMRSLRKDAENRLIIGSMGRVMGTTQKGLSQNWATRQLARLFPTLGPVRFAHAWDGCIAMTPDHMPRILTLDEGLLTPIGYNGRGITTGTIFGAAIADILTGGPTDDLPLPLTTPQPIRARRLRDWTFDAVFAGNQFLRRR